MSLKVCRSGRLIKSTEVETCCVFFKTGNRAWSAHICNLNTEEEGREGLVIFFFNEPASISYSNLDNYLPTYLSIHFFIHLLTFSAYHFLNGPRFPTAV